MLFENSEDRIPVTISQKPETKSPEKPEIFDFIVFRGSTIP